MRLAKGDPNAARGVLKVGWEALAHTHRLLAEIPLDAVNEPVLTKQLAVQRYATSLLVRLRRLVRNEDVGPDDELDLDDDLSEV